MERNTPWKAYGQFRRQRLTFAEAKLIYAAVLSPRVDPRDGAMRRGKWRVEEMWEKLAPNRPFTEVKKVYDRAHRLRASRTTRGQRQLETMLPESKLPYLPTGSNRSE